MPLAHRSARIAATLTFLVGAAVGVSIIPGATIAQESLTTLSVQSAADFVAQPLTNSATRTPVVMLALAVDEQVFRRAYDDLSDLDGDGVIDVGYVNGIRYAGYFDPDLCYAYADGRYIASAAAADHRCSSAWSGNFMNWAAMTRIDLIRQALFGGLRSLDGETRTVLERAHVPEDSHAWVKIYSGPDLADFTPFAQSASGATSFCNVTRETQNGRRSQFSNAPPLLRVAQGAFPQWSSIESRQCDGVNGAPRPGTPGATGSQISEYVLRVEVCAAGTTPQESNCTPYPNGGRKPTGLLQKYGESGGTRFGMVARSYSRPRSGGQLRRNAGLIAGNGSDPTQCALGDEIRLNTGAFCPSSAGAGSIVQSLQRLRISEFRFNGPSEPVDYTDCDRTNQFTRAPGDDGIRRPGPVSDGEGCNAYGNPVAEILGETLRYLAAAGEPATAYFSSGDRERDFLPGLETPNWQDPLAAIGECADCNIVLISNAPPSFDADELPSIGAGAGTIGPAAFRTATDAIGLAEGLTGSALIGRREETTPSATDISLDAAACAVAAGGAPLSQVRGACPAQPARDGSFLSAGVAYLGLVNDLRPALPGTQRARTYAVELSSAVPTIRVPMPDGNEIALTPSCQSFANNPNNRLRQCSFTAAQPGPITASDGQVYGRPVSASGRSGSVYVAWDEAPYGQSQENNASALLTWCVGAECGPQGAAGTSGNLCFRTSATSAAACTAGALRAVADDELIVRIEQVAGYISEPVRMGFVIEGADGADANGTFNLLARPSTSDLRDLFRGIGVPLPATWTAAEVRAYRANPTAPRSLPSPLSLAAKYGNFDADEGDGSALPGVSAADGDGCSATSWDRVDNATGAPSPDCIPDSYHGLSNPGLIGERLERVIRDIIVRSSEAETLRAGVQSGFAQVPGAVFQTFYETEATDTLGRRATWIGNVQSLFVDRDGNFREDDSSLDGRLDELDYSGHPVVQLFFDGLTRQTRFRRYTANPADDPDAFAVVDDIRQLRTLWSARNRLAALADVTSQRDYAASAATGRYIFSFADLNLDGKADAGETVAFTPDSFAAGRSGVLNVGSASQAATLINWTRGQDAPGLRARQLDRDGSGARTQRLGDIVNSEPLVVGAPGEAYDLLYGDASYAGFFRQYRNRRQMVYVGANDGMLHAFNAGYRLADNGGFSTLPPAGSATEHPLGSEIWAYVPFNLLPHLGFLASPGYVHQWTMDGSPRAFDVRAFAEDATHPGGWGTVLVVGMRLGGAPVTIPDVGANGANRPAVADFAAGLGSTTELTSRSAYVVLDITDPEQPPRLIAEISAANGALGMTTSRPAVVPFITPAVGGSPRSDAWYLMFGNGPDDHEPATSTRDARLFALDLATLLAAGGTPASALQSFAADGVSEGAVNFAPASFVGDPIAVDWDLNYRADALYFGTSGGSPAGPTGRLFKLDFNPTDAAGGETPVAAAWRAPALLIDPQRPVLAAPSVTQDERGNRWVLGGTGRLLSPADRGSVARQSLFGVIDRLPAGDSPASFDALVNTTAAVVTADGSVSGLAGIANEAELVAAVRGLPGGTGAGGWRFLLGEGNATRGAERNISRTALLDSVLFASGYTPSEALCADEGSSRLFGVNFQTGAARSVRPALSRTVVVGGVDVVEPLNVVDLGRGLSGTPSLNVNGGPGTGRGNYRINVQTTTGAIQQRQADDGGRIRSNEIDWRETHPSAAP